MDLRSYVGYYSIKLEDVLVFEVRPDFDLANKTLSR